MKENEGTGTPKELEESGLIRVTRTQISRRMKRLSEYGLLKHIGHGAYIITDEGKAYLQGEYDAEEETYINSQDRRTPTSESTSEANGT